VNQPTTIPTTQAAMANVEAQPSHRSQPVIVNFPMIRGCAVSIRMVMTGTATTLLITAVQYRALMESIGLSVMTTPRTAAVKTGPVRARRGNAAGQFVSSFWSWACR
jgi:hypothetical protein